MTDTESGVGRGEKCPDGGWLRSTPGPSGKRSPRRYTRAEVAAARRLGLASTNHPFTEGLGGPIFFAGGDYYPDLVRQKVDDYRLIQQAMEREWEAGQSSDVPEAAVEAALGAIDQYIKGDPSDDDARWEMRNALTAALPHLEAAGDARIKELEEALDDQRKGWDESMAAVEAETLAKVRERVRAERPTDTDEIMSLEARRLNAAYNAGILNALAAIDRESGRSPLPRDREPFGNPDQLESPLPEDREAPTNPGAVSAAKSEQRRLHHYRAAAGKAPNQP